MKFSDLLLYILGALSSLGILAGGIGYLVSQFKKGSNDALESADKLTDFWKKQAEDYKLMNDEKDKVNAVKFEELNSRIGQIQGQFDEKSKQADEYLKILQNRDPDTIKFQQAMTDSMTKLAEVLGEIHTMAKIEHERDLKITSTISKN